MIAGSGHAMGAAVLGMLLFTNGIFAQTPSACQTRLAAGHVVFKPLGDVVTPGGCGGPDLILLEGVMAADHSEIAIEPPATMRCEFAETVAHFVSHDLAPSVAAMGSTLATIENYDSYDCRSRNRVSGAPLSEHGRANALDIRSLRFKDGSVLRPASGTASLEFRRVMKAQACASFTTVLGPGSDSYHEDHIHVDLGQHHGGHGLCEWDLHDGGEASAVAKYGVASVRSAVPLPRPRPFDAAAGSHVPLPLPEDRP
jgi:hypothetical protein